MNENREVDFDELQEDIENAQILSRKMADLKFKQLNETNNKIYRRDTDYLLKKYINYYLLLQQDAQNNDKFRMRLCDFELFMNDILHEWKKVLFMEKRLNVVSKVRDIKLRLYMVTTSDTCTSHMKQLDQDAGRLLEELEENQDNLRFPELFQNLKELILLTLSALENAKKQVIIEAVSGVLTLGASAASGALGAVAIAGRSATMAAKGVAISSAAASDVVLAGKCVSTAANIVIEAVNVGTAISNGTSGEEITPSHSKQLSNERFQRLYSMIRYLIAQEGDLKDEDLALKTFNKMTKDEIDFLHPQ